MSAKQTSRSFFLHTFKIGNKQHAVALHGPAGQSNVAIGFYTGESNFLFRAL
jgi:hypothetical protein